MRAIGAQRIEFTPQRDILGKTIEKSRIGHRHPADLKGL